MVVSAVEPSATRPLGMCFDVMVKPATREVHLLVAEWVTWAARLSERGVLPAGTSRTESSLHYIEVRAGTPAETVSVPAVFRPITFS